MPGGGRRGREKGVALVRPGLEVSKAGLPAGAKENRAGYQGSVGGKCW